MEEPKNADFQTMQYWDKRYANEGPDEDFDWFRKYSDIREIIHELVPQRSSRILMLGCGNSTLSKDMFDDGYTNIVNLDYSQVLIDKMRTRFRKLDWRVMDVRTLRENAAVLGGAETWDAIIDKGTMDALMAENASVWNPSEAVLDNVAREVDGVLSLLKPRTGVFLYFTFGQPHFRRPHLQRDTWAIETRELGDMFHYYLYIGRKM
ncbi:hypothetical protein MVES1_003895 [Malassezia vespertilionis]|uniref:Methyltransferase domain-containing protein n=1 Tax=Malassezia vespertilionis TaxID=2020962 RepID=A0A2N1J7N4_9BASI|nr:uncharacterized protein MVES1_003895 [Malassezia vespertilionis]PKI82566.1 hypothetical protein MVES_003450 [Malassezia vespertilionis]WFD08519.1 hypothetical protein MVES1_003895 [Malassezia vespertilionis]